MKNHPYVEKCTKDYNVAFIQGTYVLEGEADANISLSESWNLLQDVVDPLPRNATR